MTNFLSLWIGAVLLAATSAGLLLSRSWRWVLGILVIQYFVIFYLILAHWSLNLSATVLFGGWMATALLGITLANSKEDLAAETSWPQGVLFRTLAIVLILIAISAATIKLVNWIPNNPPSLTWAALVLIGLGLLHLGMTLQPLRVIIGLISSLSGFEIFYSSIENSILVAGLLVIVTLGLAMAGCYMLLLGEQTT